MTKPCPHPVDIYPSEIIEWSCMLTEPEDLTDSQMRALDTLTAADVMHAAPHAIAAMLADNDHWQDEDRASRLDGFWRFIEEAAALPEQQPPGSHLRAPGELPMFSTSNELRRDISSAASAALELAELICRIAPTVTDALPLAESRRLIDSLDELYSACTAKAYTHSTKTNGVPDFPLPDDMAGADAWGNWMLSKLDMLAAIHLRGTFPALVLAVQQALIDEASERAAPAPYEIRGTRAFSIAM